MIQSTSVSAIALTCSMAGRINRVIRDDWRVANKDAVGQSVISVIADDNIGPALRFLLEVRTRGSATNWLLKLQAKTAALTLCFAGVAMDGEMLIAGAETLENLVSFAAETSSFGDMQRRALSTALQFAAEDTRPPCDRDYRMFDDIDRLNNELINLHREAAKRNIQLEQLNEQKNTFLGMASHELRYPLGTLQMYNEFLVDELAGKIDPEHQRFLVIIADKIRSMKQILDDYLDIAKIESGKLELHRSRVNLTALAAEIVGENEPVAKKRNRALRFVAASDPITVLIDRDKIEQVINNLICNAITYSHPDTIVEVRVSADEHKLIVSVRDQSPGISTADLATIFDPFVRRSGNPPAGPAGAGLGLAISHKIISAHGGRLWADSELGKGSTFQFELPLPR